MSRKIKMEETRVEDRVRAKSFRGALEDKGIIKSTNESQISSKKPLSDKTFNIDWDYKGVMIPSFVKLGKFCKTSHVREAVQEIKGCFCSCREADEDICAHCHQTNEIFGSLAEVAEDTKSEGGKDGKDKNTRNKRDD